MKIKTLIFAVLETILKVVVLAAAVMFIVRGVRFAYDFGYRVFKDEPVSVSGGRTITVGVAENASVRDTARMLEEKGLIRDEKLFVVQELLSSYHGKIKPGIYDLSTSMTANEMLQVMSDSSGEEEEEISVPQNTAEEEEPVYTEDYEDTGSEEGLLSDEDASEEDTSE